MVNLYYPFSQNGYLGSNPENKWLTKSHQYLWASHRYVLLPTQVCTMRRFAAPVAQPFASCVLFHGVLYVYVLLSV
jgi:hypothetical protein